MNKNIKGNCPDCQTDLTHDLSNNFFFDLDRNVYSDSNDFKCKKCSLPLVITVSMAIDVEQVVLDSARKLNQVLGKIQ